MHETSIGMTSWIRYLVVLSAYRRSLKGPAFSQPIAIAIFKIVDQKIIFGTNVYRQKG